MNAKEFLDASADCDRCPLRGNMAYWKGREWDISPFFFSQFHVVLCDHTIVMGGGVRVMVIDNDSVLVNRQGALMVEYHNQITWVDLPGLRDAQDEAADAVEAAILSRNGGME